MPRGAVRTPAQQGVDDPSAGVAILREISITDMNRGRHVIGQAQAVVLGGQEHPRLEEGQPGLLHGAGLAQQADQLLGLAVGKDQRIVVGVAAPVARPGPGARVAIDVARAALDLDQEETLWGQDQQVHLVEGAIGGDELEVGPGTVGVVVRQAFLDEGKRLSLPREL